MRGKDKQFVKNKIVERITPAYAGKSIQQPEKNWFAWDHPRLCGEKGGVYVGELSAAGSPPPMRGKAAKEFTDSIENRITPAYAGKSCRRDTHLQAAKGSPPPMRGKV